MKTLGDKMTDDEIDEMMFEAEVKDGMINIHGKYTAQMHTINDLSAFHLKQR